MGFYSWRTVHKIKIDQKEELENDSKKILIMIDNFFDKILKEIEEEDKIGYIGILETFCDELIARDIYDEWYQEYQKK